MKTKDTYEFLRKLILPLEEIDRALPTKARIIELGCGRGVISSYLSHIKTREITGVDIDEKSLPKTNTRFLKFKKADIRSLDFKNYQGAIISDVLHHLSKKDQNKLLKNISTGFKKGNVLVIKEIDIKEQVRSKLSRFWDLVFYPQDKITYWNSDSLKKLLRELRFKVKVTRASRFFPGSTTLFICTKY